MKEFFKNRERFKGAALLLVMLLCSLCGVVDGSVMAAEAAAGAGGGDISTGAGAGAGGNNVVTTQYTREHSAELLLNEIEKKVVHIRPMGNPLEQISRYASRRSSKSVIVEHYTTDTLAVDAKILVAYVESASDQVTLDTTNNKIYSKYETLLIPSVKGYNKDGSKEDEAGLMLYVLGKTQEGKLIVAAVNGKTIGETEQCIPSIPADSKIIRAGRAHNETDMQTTTYACTPTKKKQYLQTFRAQIEESTLQKIADKEADWNFTDLENEAIFDMKRGMSKTFYCGVDRVIMDLDGKEVYFTKGIWWQAGKTFAYGRPGDTQFTKEDLVDLHKVAFTGNAGNKEKVFIVGSDLMSNLSKIDHSRVMTNEKTFTMYGIRFKEITTNFGTLLTVHDESLDELGLSNSGIIIDVDYLRKYSIKELQTMDFDFRKGGTADVDARAISEISGLVLQNPDAHVRVVPLA